MPASSSIRENSIVWRIEHGERRLDVVEFFWGCEVLWQDASSTFDRTPPVFPAKSRGGSRESLVC